MNNWIFTKDRMPEPNEMVLLFLKNNQETGQIVGTVFHSEIEDFKEFNGLFKAFDGGGDFSPSFLKNEYVIAWMPLPEPPKAALINEGE